MHLIKAQTRSFDFSLCPTASSPAVASTLRGRSPLLQEPGLSPGAFYWWNHYPLILPIDMETWEGLCPAERSSLAPSSLLPHPQAVEKC